MAKKILSAAELEVDGIPGKVVESKAIEPRKMALDMRPQYLQAEDIVYVYGILSTYRTRVQRAIDKHKKKPDYANDPQFIFDASEMKRINNVITKLFSLRARIKAEDDESELKANAGVSKSS